MTTLTKTEQIDLKVAEAIIEKNLGGFLEMGAALVAIREDRLYRDTHATFEDYVQERWNIGRSRAYQLIGACEDGKDLESLGVSEMPANERQLRELVKAPKEKRQKAMDKAKEKAEREKRKPTAKDISVAVAEVEYEDVEDDDELALPIQVNDSQLAISNAVIGKRIVAAIDQARKLLKQVEEVPGTELLVSRERSIMRELESVRNALMVTIPEKVCPRCGGPGCVQCGNMGWVNSILARELG